MHSRRVRRTSRRGPLAGGPFGQIVLITAGTCVAALAVGYVVTSGHGERAVDAAGVWSPGPGAGPGGWGRGGYTMMPGPAGAAASGSQAPGFAANAAAVISQNWSGYAAAGNPGTFTSVAASWTQPAVTCTNTNTFASFWAGLDGDGTNSVEQTGTEADCHGGAATYQGWFEMFPNAPVFYTNPVKPGDAMTASVVANGGGAFTLTLTDTTQGWNQSTNQTSTVAQLGSAEVIAEAPSDGNGNVLPLSNFGTVSFTNATADHTAIANENASALTMVSAGGVTEATPSALTGGNAFTVTWDSNGTSGTAPAPSATAGTTPGRHHHHHWFGG